MGLSNYIWPRIKRAGVVNIIGWVCVLVLVAKYGHWTQTQSETLVPHSAGRFDSDHNAASTIVVGGFDNILAQKSHSSCQEALVKG
ncbi:uncharacterized protein AB675_4754 [Cyphellophora attinorum]|uniref:Uncharacterized protein n=1 Tax=Cyphellophora attinorum TaxID=1664694 RepID=A0A0N0NIM8_9EURO|nr:uncharacterized protein AB675_4754 [Phialophora attinorum]KPI35629.1 hypothetical protein AB675_4754 [Phialophora attinorum]